MNHLVLFKTKEGSFLVFVHVGKYVDIKTELKERIEVNEITFEDAEDVAEFMNKYIEDVEKPGYHPYWQFEDVITL